MKVEKCLIIAAGMGTRLAGVGDSKPLVQLSGKPLIVRVIETVRRAGVNEFFIVTGYKAEKVEAALTGVFGDDPDVTIHFIRNHEWEKPNGLSVLKAGDHIRVPFFLVMSDHMFDPVILEALQGFDARGNAVTLAVDKRLEGNPLVDLDDVTKVYEENGKIVHIGKTITPYNAFDTGVFCCTPGLFGALAESIESGDASLSGGMKILASAGKAGVMDIGDAFWIDVDNEEMLGKAKKLLAHGTHEKH